MSPSMSTNTSTPESTTSPSMFSFTSGAVTATASVVEFGSSYHSTGICFLDHMVDQLTSHGQLGVTMKASTTVAADGTMVAHEPHVDYAGGSLMDGDRPHDEDIFIACGTALGAALRYLVETNTTTAAVATSTTTTAASVFLCPLDEAFAEARLELSSGSSPTPQQLPHTNHTSCELAPYGTMPPQGRRWIGCYRCNLTPLFFQHLSGALGCPELHLRKVRGHNAHHIVESTFKSFARVFRACLDELTLGGQHGCVKVGEKRLAARRNEKDNGSGVSVDGGVVGGETNHNKDEHRIGSRSRTTKETTIEVNVDLDRHAPTVATTNAGATAFIYTGVELMDRILAELRETSGFHFDVYCDGDIYIDDHHTVEDVAITLGQCLNVALGSKAGLARMGCAEATCGGATVRCVMDLSNRPYFQWDLPLDEEYVGGDAEASLAMRKGAVNSNGNKNGNISMLCGSALTCEMLQHVFESLTIETRATVHMEIRNNSDGNGGAVAHQPLAGHSKDLAIASARAFGTALAECVRVDPRRAGKVASSKGTLSV